MVPPAAAICWFSELISDTRSFNSSVFLEIRFVCVVTTSSALALAASLALVSSDTSDEEQGGDKLSFVSVVRIATMAVALAVLYSEELESIALVRSVIVDLSSLQLAGVG